jgi:hypothetical protein
MTDKTDSQTIIELRRRGWLARQADSGIAEWYHPSDPNRAWPGHEAVLYAIAVEYPAADSALPAPRPTCGTCPHWVQSDPADDLPDIGECRATLPVPEYPGNDGRPVAGFLEIHRSKSCGQHPDMDAWIKAEWPKVKR